MRHTWLGARVRQGNRLCHSRWLLSAITGVALSAMVGSSLLAEAYPIPDGVPATDSSGRSQQVGSAGLKLIEEFEGLELTGYVLGDGMCTIGYGHAIPISEKPAAACKSWTISQAEAEEFLRQDVARFGDNLNTYFTRSFSQNQFDALTSFSYNVGYAYEKYDWPKDAPDSYFPGVMIQYVNPPQFREGLTKRRKAEIALFQNPSGPEVVESITNSPAEPTLDATETPAPAPAAPEVSAPAPAAPVDTGQVEVPAPAVIQLPDVTPLFAGGISAR